MLVCACSDPANPDCPLGRPAEAYRLAGGEAVQRHPPRNAQVRDGADVQTRRVRNRVIGAVGRLPGRRCSLGLRERRTPPRSPPTVVPQASTSGTFAGGRSLLRFAHVWHEVTGLTRLGARLALVAITGTRRRPDGYRSRVWRVPQPDHVRCVGHADGRGGRGWI